MFLFSFFAELIIEDTNIQLNFPKSVQTSVDSLNLGSSNRDGSIGFIPMMMLLSS